ncbi:Na(+)-translocating NADH-quinone reductase subunit F [Subsaxibacter sp. CAU 1640]|uniref:Na(+)-translocating NADH-quinone reductase subunit F n=1 Tax=Subsaxibacter sp. CAU 1640 TaxID=2933271 RepID=UPI002005A900|nr:Na(+)-translocating NADH-quinone reductase subunit F [Subsaxibacter sp. CAU 1640]MCK7590186.1 Na(+)-translocating NADH-quinone reductase subunit F [Subsaxibacter sp. CAU 1640]
MNTSKRFDSAIKKLYNAFHNNQLHPECCQQCAVGNILDNKDSWKHLSDEHGSLKLNYVGLVNQNFGKKFNGYSPLELLKIEASFLKGCGYSLPLNHKGSKPENPDDKDVLFNGLCKAIKVLCDLDNISNVMDYSKMFKQKSTSVKFATKKLTV